MPAFDQCHEQVVRALQKDGWRLEQTAVKLFFDDRYAYVDMKVSRGINGNREQMLLVEVKCFPDKNSTTRDLYAAIGQYLVYRAMIRALDQSIEIYLSIPSSIFNEVFDDIVLHVIEESRINVVVINLETETIVKWIASQN